MTSKAKTPSAETIEGDAVEKPTTATSPDRDTAKPAKAGAKPSAGIITALSLAFISILVALFSLYQNQSQDLSVKDIAREQVDALTLRLAAVEQAVDENKQTSDDALRGLDAKITQQAETLPSGDVSIDDMAKRLAVLTDRLAAVEDVMAEATLSENATSASPPVIDATSALVPQDDIAVAATDRNRLLSRVPMPPAQPEAVLAQASLVAVSGLLADNMAGRPVNQWHDVLHALWKKGIFDFDMETLSALLVQNPPSRGALLGDADHVITAMADHLNSKDVDETLLGQVGTKLGKLVNLRATDFRLDSPAGQLAAFEEAITANNFDAALQVTQKWQGHDVAALTEWRVAATTRHQLDATIMQLVAAVLADMAEAR